MALRLRGLASASACCRRTRKDHYTLLLSFGNSSLTLIPNSHLPLMNPSSSPRVKFGIRAISSETVIPKKENEKSSSQEDWRIKMLYDGDCPLCMREVNMLRERNKEYKTIKFVDICSQDYSPEENQGLDFQTAMGRIHAILADGTVVTDVEAFRKLYEQVGLGWVYAVTKYEPIGKVVDSVYAIWAKYRLQITGRPPLNEIMELRRKNKGKTCKESDSCEM